MINVYSIISLIAGTICIILAGIVYFNNVRNLENVSFSIVAFCAGVWTLFSFVSIIIYDKSLSMFPVHLLYTAAVFTPLAFLWFCLITTDIYKHKKEQILSIFCAFLTGLFVVANYKALLVKDIYLKGKFPVVVPGKFFILFGIFFSLVCGYGFLQLLLSYRKSLGIKRNKFKYFFLGCSCGYIAAIIHFQAAYTKFEPFPHDILLVLFPTIVTYAISKHRLVDIRLATRGFVIYGAFCFVYTLIFTSIFMIFETSVVGIICIFMVIFTTPFVYPVWKKIFQPIYDDTVLRGKYDYLDKLRQAAESSQPLHTSSEVAERMVEGISSAMNVENCSFMMYNSWRNQFRPKAHKGLKGVLGDYQIMPGITWEVTEPIVKFLVNKKRALVKEEIATSPSKENVPIIDAMTKIHAEVAVPIFIEYKLIGILGIGRKNTGDMFDTTDLKLLSQLARTLERDLSHTYFMEERTVFSSKVAHDLRSPFNWIMNSLFNMNVGVYGEISEEQREELSKVFEGMRLLERNIREFFNLNVLLQQVTHGEYRVAKGDIGMLIKNVMDRFKPVGEKQGLGFAVELPSNIPKVIMNTEDIEQHVLGNLITNALKYTNKGKITLGVEVVVAGVICKVQDTGIGIPKHALPHVLKPFFHLHTAGEDKQTGVGLGLVIVKEVVEANGGRVWVESVEGKGATFYFTLPIA